MFKGIEKISPLRLIFIIILSLVLVACGGESVEILNSGVDPELEDPDPELESYVCPD